MSMNKHIKYKVKIYSYQKNDLHIQTYRYDRTKDDRTTEQSSIHKLDTEISS